MFANQNAECRTQNALQYSITKTQFADKRDRQTTRRTTDSGSTISEVREGERPHDKVQLGDETGIKRQRETFARLGEPGTRSPLHNTRRQANSRSHSACVAQSH